MKSWPSVLEDDLRWREAELASLKRITIVNADNDVMYKAFLRASWAMLYAHFEGFTRFCWELLLDQVQLREIPINELDDNFRLLALRKSFKKLHGNLDAQSLWEFFSRKLPILVQEKAAFSKDCRLDAESNLWPNVFERECSKVGIRSNELETHQTRMKTLVSRRNDIAHGESMTIQSIDEYSEYEKVTMMVMHDLAVQVLSILEEKKYLQPAAAVD